MAWLFVLWCHCLFVPIAAFSWLGSRPSPTPQLGLEEKSGLTPSEIDALFLNVDALESYSRKPDCFRRAASLIRSQCSELDLDEDARIKAAIQMTLCELATARHHSPPLECSMFSDALESGFAFVSSTVQGDCVEALSRSAQFWSSYSGYLREVPQLCYAFRRWNDIDTARDIYKNATLEKLALIQVINRREQAALESLMVFNGHLEEMRIVLGHLSESGLSIGLSADEISARFARGFDHTVQLLKDAIAVNQRQGQEHLAEVVSKVDAALEHIVARHTVALMNVLPTISASFTSQLDEVSAFVFQQNQNALEVANELERTWRSLAASFVSMHQSMSYLVHVASSATEALLLHSKNAAAVHAMQNDTKRAVAELVDVMSQLRNVARTELEWINSTGSDIRQNILQQDKSDWTWCWEMMVWVVKVAWRVDRDVFTRFTSIRFILLLADLFRRLFQLVISSWMSCFFVLLISCRKRIPRSSPRFSYPSDDSITPTKSRARHVYPGVRKQFHCYHDSSTPRIRRISRIPDRLCNPTPVP